ncbi:MAG TPA: FxLYD domain-containing protein [Nitrososphaeraceae archaeon]
MLLLQKIMKKVYSIVLSSLVFALAIPFAYGQQLDNPTNPTTTINQNTTTNAPESIIGKSENLTITDLRYRAESNQITGTVTNNSTNEQSSITIYAVLFDSDDSFLGIAEGRPLVESLPPSDNSPFSIDLLSGFGFYAMPEDPKSISHYTIYVKGSEPLF